MCDHLFEISILFVLVLLAFAVYPLGYVFQWITGVSQTGPLFWLGGVFILIFFIIGCTLIAFAIFIVFSCISYCRNAWESARSRAVRGEPEEEL